MRSLSGERADGTFELLCSRPYRLRDIVLGKYGGILTIALLAILPTIMYAVTINTLAFPRGNIDIGATIGSYLGLFFLTSVYGAIGIFCSSLTKNPIIAFLLGVFANFIAYYGIDAFSNMSMVSSHSELIKNLGIQAHYHSVSRGVLTVSDTVYFVSVSALFLLLTVGHTGRIFRKRTVTLAWYASALAGYIVLNHFSAPYLTSRIDFTEDKRFTLNATSKELLKSLTEMFISRYFWTVIFRLGLTG